jgi:hypothetical protein
MKFRHIKFLLKSIQEFTIIRLTINLSKILIKMKKTSKNILASKMIILSQVR